MILSVLIATIPQRTNLFCELYKRLIEQSAPGVEILISSDRKEQSIGTKRQALLERASGNYITFIDDDDTVPEYYILEIIKAVETLPDCIGFKIHCDISGTQRSAVASLKYRQWAENIDGYHYVRSIYHKTPVKRSIALQAGFKDLRYAEDHDYAMRLQPYLKTEVFINKIMYYYRYTNEDHQTKFGIKN